MSGGVDQTEQYEIRPYRQDDRQEYLALFEDQWNPIGPEWFEWRFENPYIEEKAITVAEHDGRIVGARPCIVFPLRSGDHSTLALQPAGTIVHPDHRGRGIYTRLAKQQIQYYTEREPTLFFNFPNEAVLHGAKKLGWTEVGRVAAYYRISPEAVIEEVGLNPEAITAKVASTAVRTLTRGATAIGRSLVGDDSDVSVSRHDSILTDLLVSLYETSVPDEIHVPRDQRFYGWRYDAPRRDAESTAPTYETYVARWRGKPVAAAVTCTVTLGGETKTYVFETQPMDTERTPGIGGIVAAIASDHRDSDWIKSARSSMPQTVAAANGFVPDTVPVLSRKADSRTMVVRSLCDDGEQPIPGRPITAMDSWRLTLCECEPTV